MRSAAPTELLAIRFEAGYVRIYRPLATGWTISHEGFKEAFVATLALEETHVF